MTRRPTSNGIMRYALILAALLVASCTSTGTSFVRTERDRPARAICADCEPPYHPLPVER